MRVGLVKIRSGAIRPCRPNARSGANAHPTSDGWVSSLCTTGRERAGSRLIAPSRLTTGRKRASPRTAKELARRLRDASPDDPWDSEQAAAWWASHPSAA